MKKYFEQLCDLLDKQCQDDEVYLANLSAEESDFIRFNMGRIRQPLRVEQAILELTWIVDDKQLQHKLNLTGELAVDGPQLQQCVARMRQDLKVVEADPYLLYQTQVESTSYEDPASGNDAGAICQEIVTAAEGLEFVGILALGRQYVGFANSLGQRNWYCFDDFNLDWSVYVGGDKAAKGNYVGKAWQGDDFQRLLRKTADEAGLMKQTPHPLEKGEYRVYLAPAALADLLDFADFGYQRYREKINYLQRWHDGDEALSPLLTMRQDNSLALAPDFQSQGFVSTDLDLVLQGKRASKLISPRSAQEYGVEHNGAGAWEYSANLDVAAGQLPQEEILSALGTGLYINNLHYLNTSDLATSRITGMTRFACFWVENGKLIAPVGVMRFDDSLYRLLGSELEALTGERERIASCGTYFQRDRSGVVLPGALLSSMRFTL